MTIRIVLFLSLICSNLLYGQSNTTTDLTTLPLREINSFLATKSSEKAKQLLLNAIKKTGTYANDDCKLQIEYRHYLIRIYNSQGNYKAALKHASALYSFQKKVSLPSALSYTKALINLAYFSKKTGAYEAALKYYHNAASLRKKHLGVESIAYANVLSDLASIYKIKANYPKAAKLLNEAYPTLKQRRKSAPRDYIAVLNNLADLYCSSGAYHKSLELYEEIQHFYVVHYAIQKDTSALLTPSITLQKDYLMVLGNIADVHKELGNYTLALSMYKESNSKTAQLFGKQHNRYIHSLMDLASGYYASEKYLSAEKILDRAKALIEQSFAGKKHPLYITVLNNLAATYLIQNNPERALPIYKEVLQMSQATQQNNRPEYAVILNNLAGAYHIKGDPKSAVLLYKEALKIKANTLGEAHPAYIKALNEIAFFYLKNKQQKACWDYLTKAIKAIAPLEAPLAFDSNWSTKIRQQAGPSNLHIQQLIRTLEGAFNLLQQADKTDYSAAKQQIIAHTAIQLLQKIQNRTTTDKDKLRLLGTQNEWIKKHLQLLQYPHKIAEAFTLAEQNKSTLLLTSTRAHQLQKKGILPDSIYLEQQQLLHKTKKLEALLLEAPSVDSRSQLNLHYQKVTELNKKIERIAPQYALKKSQASLQSLAQIQQKLDKETALIEYVISDSCLHIFLCTQGQKIWKKVPLSKALLKAKVYTLRKNLSDYHFIKSQPAQAKEHFIQNASWAYTQLLAPVLEASPTLKNLIIIPDGILGVLPFECLLTQTAPAKTPYKQLPYLVKKYNISYNYSANLWAEIRTKKTNINNGQILATAPSYTPVNWPQQHLYRLKTDINERKSLLPLLAIKQEVEALQEQFKGKFLYGFDASERSVKAIAKDYAVLHFAVHGRLEKRHPMLSSLAFAENKDTVENNFWQAHEIASSRLNANLVVLSSCETGYGAFQQGNGIASIARAFMYANVSALVVSLWPVNDYSTAPLMGYFYQNLAKGVDKDQALRNAKLSYIAQAEDHRAHPAYWAPFIQQGDKCPIQLRKKTPFTLWVLGGIFLLSTLALAFIYTKKKRLFT